MSSWLRSALLPALAVAYVCVAAMRGASSSLPLAALIGLPLLLVVVWRRTDAPRTGEDHTLRTARLAVRAVVTGAAFWVAARSGAAGRPGLDAVANLGTGVAIVSALIALGRIGSLGGLLAVPPAARSLDAAAFAALLWGIATALPATRALAPAESILLDPLAIDYATTTAAAGSLLLLFASCLRLRILRRYELGAGDRVAGALAMSVAALGAAVPAALLDVAAPDRLLPVAALGAALACTWAASTREPSRVSSTLRGLLAVLILGIPVVLAAGFVARQAPAHAGAVVLFTAVASILTGLLARNVARPLGPEQSRWLDAVENASRAALQPDPETALSRALFALTAASPSPNARPELWRTDPAAVLSVDLAGYLHEKPGQAPERLYELALQEPERTLRTEVLAALQVRRPEVRPVLRWMESRDAAAATVIVDDEGPLGFILLPRTGRAGALMLEEARAIRLLADRISSLLSVSSALARSRARELSAIERADATDDELHRLEHILGLDAGRNRALAERWALGVKTTCFSPAARDALSGLERYAKLASALYLQAPQGVDALGWAAAAHLAGPRSNGPLVPIDCTDGHWQLESRWDDRAGSPLALADGGTLVLLDVAALPEPAMRAIARALTRATNDTRRSTILPPAVFATGRASIDELASLTSFEPTLLRYLAQAAVSLPRLSERAEDMRGLVLDGLSRAGLRKNSRPLGVDGSALRLLIEHTWPGNDAELQDVLERAATVATGERVMAADLLAAGFRPVVSEASSATPLPVSTRPRTRPRRMLRRS